MRNRPRRARFWELALMLTWELPQTLLGLLVLGAVAARGAVLAFEWCYGRICVRTRATGVSLGALVFWFRGPPRDPDDVLRHELGHCVQSRLLGPLYLLLVGVPSLLRAGYARRYYVRHRRSWSRYRSGYPERWADELAPPREALEQRRE